MPEITADERGRRAFKIQKERAAEDAIEKIRLGIGQDWMLFSHSDIDLLRSALGDAWVAMNRQVWERCAFTRLDRTDIEEIIRIAKDMYLKEEPRARALSQVIEILRKGL